MPAVSRPDMPDYAILPPDEGRGLLPWAWAQERLARSHKYWLATVRPDGRPHLAPVWGVWIEEAFSFSAGRLSRKARNLQSNPRCVVSTETAEEAVIVEGEAAPAADPDRLASIGASYAAKYGEPYPDGSLSYTVRPRVAFGFIEDAADFSGAATRWRFANLKDGGR